MEPGCEGSDLDIRPTSRDVRRDGSGCEVKTKNKHEMAFILGSVRIRFGVVHAVYDTDHC